MRTLARVFALSAFLAMASFNASAQTPTTTPANPPAPTSSTAPAMPPEQPAQEIVANPYSLTALWQGGDVIARSTIVILAIMSVSTWYVLITKFAEQAFLLRLGREASRKFWTSVSFHAGADSLGRNSAFRMVVEDGLKAAEHHEG
jgi:biopolymer transport protein ExbB